MFDRNSRYATTATYPERPATRPRTIVAAAGVIEHQVEAHDRLDRLAAHYYGDPHKWWLILDANPDIAFGGDLDMGRYAGEIIVIPANRTKR